MATGTGNLPHPGMVATPFDIYTAEEVNQHTANIESLADGSGIGDGAITASKLDLTTFAFGNYSTSEVNTGFKWIDGRAIYQKTINFGTMPNSTDKSIAHGITNLGYVIKYDSMMVNSSKNNQPVPRPTKAGTAQSALEITATNIIIGATVDMSSYSTYITLFYIKTA